MLRLILLIGFAFLALEVGSQSYETLVQQGDFEGASTKAEQPIQHIQCAVELGKWELADRLLKTLSIKEQDSDFSLYCLLHGQVLMKQKKQEQARQFLEKGAINVKDRCETEQEIQENLAYLDVLNGKGKTAEPRFLKALEAKKACSVSTYGLLKSYSRLMQCYYYTSDYPKALEMIKIATSMAEQEKMDNVMAAKLWGNQGVVQKKLGDLKGAKTSYHKGLLLYKKRVDSLFDPMLIASYNNIANIHFSLEEVETGMRYLDTLELIQTKGANDPDALSSIYLNRGIYGNTVKDKIHYFEKVLSLKELVSRRGKPNVAQSYNNLAILYQQKGNLAEAENYNTSVLNYLNQINIRPAEFMAKVLERRATLHYLRSNSKEAIIDQEKAIELIVDSQGMTNRNAAVSYMKLGDFYIADEQFDAAKKTLDTSLGILNKLYAEKHPIKGMVYNKLGDLKLKNNDPDAAIKFFNQAITALKNNPAFARTNLPDSYHLLAKAHHLKNDSASAKQHHLDMLKQVGFQITDDQLLIDSIADYNQFSAIRVYEWYLSAKPTLKQSEIEIALQLFQDTRSNYFFEQSELEFKKTTKKLFSRCLEDQFSKWEQDPDAKYADMAYRLMELYKSGSLDRPFLRKDQFQNSKLPETVVATEKQIVYEYELAYQEYRNYLEGNYKGSSNEEALQQKIIHWQAEKKQFLSRLKRDYPDYYQMRYAGMVVPFKIVQDRAENYLTNFWGESSVFSLLIQNDTCVLRRQMHDSVQANLSQVAASLSLDRSRVGEAGFQAEKATFIQQSHILYQALVAPFIRLLDKDQPLCVIPDGLLWYLPYDILLTESAPAATSYRDLPYLMQEVAIHYDVSVSLNVQQPTQVAGRNSYVGFAPSYSGDESMANLRNQQALYATAGEIQEAAKRFNGIHFQGKEATRANFVKQAPNAQILHLAMHAEVNDQVPMRSALQFYDEEGTDPLYLYDIAQLELNNQLVILSACATQQGKIAEGEGLLSISRAFQLAGSPNLVNTHWPVNDRVARQVIGDFLDQLSIGPSESLRKAKQQYLNSSSEYYAHPSYWAAFNYHGKTEKIKINSNQNLWIILLLISVLGLIAFLFSKKTSKKV